MTESSSLHDAEQTLEVAQAKRYATYPVYRSSGVDWLGEIPQDWNVKRLKFLTRLINEKVEANEDTEQPYIGMEHVQSWTGSLLPLNDDFVPTGISNVFQPGDVLFGKLRPYLAKATTVDFKGLCSSELMVLRPNKLDRRFLLYAMLSDGFIKLVDSSTYGAKMPRANWEFIGSMRTPVPSIDEQQAIARFLDEQTKKIDDLIKAKRDLLVLLTEKRQAIITHAVTKGLNPDANMQPSGLEWLGDIPEHWILKPLRFLGDAIIGLTYSPDDVVNEGEGVLVLRASNIQDGHIIDGDNVYVDVEVPDRLRIRADDILICSRSGSRDLIGKNAIISPDVTDCTFGAFMTVFRSESNDFIYWVLNSRLFAFHSGSFMTTTINQLTLGTLKAFSIPLPPPFERRAIVEHIKARTSVIDYVIKDVKSALHELSNYRTALISAAVTGKIDVRGGAA